MRLFWDSKAHVESNKSFEYYQKSEGAQKELSKRSIEAIEDNNVAFAHEKANQ
jgi:hypothetical protein